MPESVSHYKKEILSEIEGLSADKLKEIIGFICFAKAREAIDPSQSYFWTEKWQKMERDADKDRDAGNVLGDGTLENLMGELNK